MHRLEEFRWTTRADVCQQLLRIALQAVPQGGWWPGFLESAPERAADLLLQFADRSCWEIAAQLAPLVRVASHIGWKVRSLLLKPELTADDLSKLQSDLRLPGGEFAGHSVPAILARFRSDEQWRMARSFLEELEPKGRASVLLSCFLNRRSPPLTPELVDWLYGQWLHHDRASLEDASIASMPLNFLITMATRRRLESRALLIESWPHLTREQRQQLIDRLSLFHFNLASEDGPSEKERREWSQEAEEDEELLSECLATAPDLRSEMVARLALPLPHLLRQVGQEELLRLIEVKIWAYSHARQAGQYGTAESEGLWEGLRLLEVLPIDGVDARIGLLCLRPELEEWTRDELRDIFWKRQWRRARAEALSMALAAASQGNEIWAGAAIRRLHDLIVEEDRGPRPEDRAFLLWASRQRWGMFRYVAVASLERLGEDGAEWRERLMVLARDRKPAVRVLAWEALVRRGYESYLSRIIRTATRARDVQLRAEALRALGELDARRHFAVLRRALLTDHAEIEYRRPAAEEAALALMRLGTPEALTTLVQAALSGPRGLWSFLAECLTKMDLFATPPRIRPGRRVWSWRMDHHHRGWLMLMDDRKAFSNKLRERCHPCRWSAE